MQRNENGSESGSESGSENENVLLVQKNDSGDAKSEAPLEDAKKVLLKLVDLAEKKLPMDKKRDFINLFMSEENRTEHAELDGIGQNPSTPLETTFAAVNQNTYFASIKERIGDESFQCDAGLATKLVQFSNNLSLRDVSLSTKQKCQVAAIAILAAVTLAAIIGIAIATHGLIIPPLLMLFKVSASAATSAVATSAVANGAAIGAASLGVSVLGFLAPSYLKLRWAQSDMMSDMKAKAAEFQRAVG